MAAGLHNRFRQRISLERLNPPAHEQSDVNSWAIQLVLVLASNGEIQK
jgi:hypothetical protein